MTSKATHPSIHPSPRRVTGGLMPMVCTYMLEHLPFALRVRKYHYFPAIYMFLFLYTLQDFYMWLATLTWSVTATLYTHTLPKNTNMTCGRGVTPVFFPSFGQLRSGRLKQNYVPVAADYRGSPTCHNPDKCNINRLHNLSERIRY